MTSTQTMPRRPTPAQATKFLLVTLSAIVLTMVTARAQSIPGRDSPAAMQDRTMVLQNEPQRRVRPGNETDVAVDEAVQAKDDATTPNDTSPIQEAQDGIMRLPEILAERQQTLSELRKQ